MLDELVISWHVDLRDLVIIFLVPQAGKSSPKLLGIFLLHHLEQLLVNLILSDVDVEVGIVVVYGLVFNFDGSRPATSLFRIGLNSGEIVKVITALVVAGLDSLGITGLQLVYL